MSLEETRKRSDPEVRVLVLRVGVLVLAERIPEWFGCVTCIRKNQYIMKNIKPDERLYPE